MSSLTKQNGAWIFVSHSHRDLEKVRQIRNEFERLGGNPLLFFLKCLDDDDKRLPELIRDEIEARNFFILCDSPNAKASKYVQDEIALVKALKDKVFVTIDLAKPLEKQFPKLERILKRATVFLSYARQDHEIAEHIRLAFSKHDYRVWSENELHGGEDWASEIGNVIDEAAGHGFVLLLLSPAALSSRYFKADVQYALSRVARSDRCNIVPIIVAPFDRSALPPELQVIQWFDLAASRFDERIQELIRSLKTREMEI